ncbi:MAG: DUF488 domain-containing protein [Bacteroidales bacterium]|nr:DUF488 domain-containing protein [Bacteroidales bacterium]
MPDTLFSIGHGNKPMEVFLQELQGSSIQFLLDVRSKPYSKWNPQYNREELQQELKAHGITYVYVGDVLGGLPEDRTCYDSDGKVIYEVIKKKKFFRDGLERLLTAHQKQVPLALMCSESNPAQCHRSKLIGQELLNHHISIKHIVGKDKVKPQELVMAELTKGKGTIDLFGNEIDFTSRKSYEP